MSDGLQFVEIPGYAEALKREDTLRRQAWANPRHSICGVEVRALTLRDAEMLAELQNGFFCPWRFDDDAEYLAHCAQLAWWLSAAPKPRLHGGNSVWHLFFVERARQRLTRHLLRDVRRLSEDTIALLRETYGDAPRGGGGSGGAGIAGSPAYIADALAAAGYPFTLDQLLDTPLVQLWQLLRVSQRRLTGVSPTNESDRLACDYLARLNARN